MALGTQGGHVKPTRYGAHVGVKHGGGSGPAGGSTAEGKTPSPVGANKKNIK